MAGSIFVYLCGGHRVRLKDESKWIKIPDCYLAIINRELFEQANGQLLHFKSVKKSAREYLLRGKVFCGCCRHAMPRIPTKNHHFICRHTTYNYKAQKAVIDKELEQLKQIHAALATQTTQMQMDKKSKSARITLAQEISGVSGLTAGLADTLIERVNNLSGQLGGNRLENERLLYGGNMMETKRTWIYCRASHNGPDADVLAIQQRRLETCAKEHGFEIVGSSSDVGNGLTLDRTVTWIFC